MKEIFDGDSSSDSYCDSITSESEDEYEVQNNEEEFEELESEGSSEESVSESEECVSDGEHASIGSPGGERAQTLKTAW